MKKRKPATPSGRNSVPPAFFMGVKYEILLDYRVEPDNDKMGEKICSIKEWAGPASKYLR
jgi:hypothetical protein